MTSGQRQIARAAIVVMAAFVVSRLLGYVRVAVIGQQFGLAPELDAYFAAFRIPDLLFNVVAGGALSSAFIPTFATYLARDDRAGAWRMASTVLTWIGLLLSAGAVLAAIFAPQLVTQVLLAGDNVPAEMQLLTIDLLRIMLIATVIFGLSGVVMAALNAQQHFLVPAVAPLLYNLGIIAGALWLAPQMGVYGLAWGVVGGAALHLLVQLPMLPRVGARIRPALSLGDPGVRLVARLMAPRMLGLAVVQINFVVETLLAAPLGTGSLSALAFAWQAMLLPQAVFAQAAATAAFPTFAEQAARGQVGALRSALSATLRSVLFLALPATIGLIILREPFIALLLERGKFDASATELVAWALRFYVLGLAAHSALEVLTRVFYALQDTRTPVVAGIASMVLNVVFSLAFIQAFRAAGVHPIGGLGLANAVAIWVETLALVWVMRRRLGGMEGTRLAAMVTRSTAASGLMALAVLAWLALFPPGRGLWNLLLAAGGGALGGAAIYWAAAWAIGSHEARALAEPILRRLRPLRP